LQYIEVGFGLLEDGATGAEKRSRGPIGVPGAFAEPGIIFSGHGCVHSNLLQTLFCVISSGFRIVHLLYNIHATLS
jgi:hypothetical protein